MAPKLLTLAAFAAFAAAASADFQLLVTETPAGSVGSAQWLGVRRYYFKTTGGPAARRIGIDKSVLHDPAGVTVGPAGEFFVANRWGNSGPADIGRFLYSAASDSFTANGSVSGNGIAQAHCAAFRPTTGEMFVMAAFSGFSRFSYSFPNFTPNGFVSIGQTRWAGFGANPDLMYIAQGVSGSLIRYNVATNTSTTYNIPGAGGIHWSAFRNNELFLGDYNSQKVYRVQFDVSGAVVSSNVVVSAPTAISVVFSPDQKEMFVAGHTSGVITRYLYNTVTGNWDPNGQINTGVNMGGMTTFSTVPTSNTLIGHVDLNDYFGPVAGQKVTVTFRQQGIDMENQEVTLDASGNWSLSTTRRGVHQIGLKGKHWLRKFTGDVNLSTTVVIPSVANENGDIDGDNSVTVFDYGVLSDYFDRSSAQAGWTTVGGNGFAPADADLDGDEAVTVFDYGIISDHFDKSGE